MDELLLEVATYSSLYGYYRSSEYLLRLGYLDFAFGWSFLYFHVNLGYTLLGQLEASLPWP